jgi:hypothetical protein
MRLVLFHVLLLAAFFLALPVSAAPDKIIKVLPQYLDLQGRNSISPSLYDRDAYQARLRRRPEERSGMEFRVQWKAKSSSELKMRLEVRGSKKGQPTTVSLDAPAKHLRGLSQWTPLVLKGEPYEQLGDIQAWRVSLWDGDALLAEQKSFLW